MAFNGQTHKLPAARKCKGRKEAGRSPWSFTQLHNMYVPLAQCQWPLYDPNSKQHHSLQLSRRRPVRRKFYRRSLLIPSFAAKFLGRRSWWSF